MHASICKINDNFSMIITERKHQLGETTKFTKFLQKLQAKKISSIYLSVELLYRVINETFLERMEKGYIRGNGVIRIRLLDNS